MELILVLPSPQPWSPHVALLIPTSNADEVIDKEISGFEILNELLGRFILSVNNNYNNTPSSYDKLLLRLLPKEVDILNDSLYTRVMNVCYFVSLFSDKKAVLTYKKIKGLAF